MKRRLVTTVLCFLSVHASNADKGYDYPLKLGTAAWENATAPERVASVQIPQWWRGEQPSSLQWFLSAITNPYFRSIAFSGSKTMLDRYTASKSSQELKVLLDAEAMPDFGAQGLSYLRSLNIVAIDNASCLQFTSPCWMDYKIICCMVGQDRGLDTMNLSSRQLLFRLAVWDANYFISSSDGMLAAPAVILMYKIFNKPVAFRGAFPPEVNLPALSEAQVSALEVGTVPQEIVPAIVSAKSTLNLTTRP